MDFRRFAEISNMLIEGTDAAMKISHGKFTRHEFSARLGKTILSELEKDDKSPGKVWTEQQVPGLRKALEEKDRTPSDVILKLAAPGLVALSAESGEQVKDLAYRLVFGTFQALSGEALS